MLLGLMFDIIIAGVVTLFPHNTLQQYLSTYYLPQSTSRFCFVFVFLAIAVVTATMTYCFILRCS